MAPIWVVPSWPIFDPGRCVRGEGARQVNGSAATRSLRVWPSDCMRGRGATAWRGPAAQRFLSTGQGRGDGRRPSTAARGLSGEHRCRIRRFFFFAPLTWVIATVDDANQALRQVAGVGHPPIAHGRSAS